MFFKLKVFVLFPSLIILIGQKFRQLQVVLLFFRLFNSFFFQLYRLEYFQHDPSLQLHFSQNFVNLFVVCSINLSSAPFLENIALRLRLLLKILSIKA